METIYHPSPNPVLNPSDTPVLPEPGPTPPLRHPHHRLENILAPERGNHRRWERGNRTIDIFDVDSEDLEQSPRSSNHTPISSGPPTNLGDHDIGISTMLKSLALDTDDGKFQPASDTEWPLRELAAAKESQESRFSQNSESIVGHGVDGNKVNRIDNILYNDEVNSAPMTRQITNSRGQNRAPTPMPRASLLPPRQGHGHSRNSESSEIRTQILNVHAMTLEALNKGEHEESRHIEGPDRSRGLTPPAKSSSRRRDRARRRALYDIDSSSMSMMSLVKPNPLRYSLPSRQPNDSDIRYNSPILGRAKTVALGTHPNTQGQENRQPALTSQPTPYSSKRGADSQAHGQNQQVRQNAREAIPGQPPYEHPELLSGPYEMQLLVSVPRRYHPCARLTFFLPFPPHNPGNSSPIGKFLSRLQVVNEQRQGTAEFDDAEIVEKLRLGYSTRLLGHGATRVFRRWLSARGVKGLRLLRNKDDRVEEVLGERFGKPASGRGQYTIANWAHVTARERNATRRQAKGNQDSPDLEFFEGWKTYKILFAGSVSLLAGVAALLVWVFLGPDSSMHAIIQSDGQVQVSDYGNQQAARVGFGAMLGLLVLLIGWTITAAWLLMSWLLMSGSRQ